MLDRYALRVGGPLLEGSGEKGGYDPQDLQSAYKISASGRSTQTIALIEAYGYDEAESDLAAYRARYGLGPCTKAKTFAKPAKSVFEGSAGPALSILNCGVAGKGFTTGKLSIYGYNRENAAPSLTEVKSS